MWTYYNNKLIQNIQNHCLAVTDLRRLNKPSMSRE